MPKATWNGMVLAELPEEVRIVEGNVYFPGGAVYGAHLEPSEKVTHGCWKGGANSHHVAATWIMLPRGSMWHRNTLQKE